MGNFLVGICIAMIAAVGAYYYWFVRQPEVQTEQMRGAESRLQVETKQIPGGAVMEDGTLPE